eukprot:6284219-Alexandrium_andersonii.AAC.1
MFWAAACADAWSSQIGGRGVGETWPPARVPRGTVGSEPFAAAAAAWGRLARAPSAQTLLRGALRA